VLDLTWELALIFGMFLLPIPIIIGFWKLGERWWPRGGWIAFAGATSYVIALGVGVLFALFLIPYAFSGIEGSGSAD
jgi:hypothetical protein